MDVDKVVYTFSFQHKTGQIVLTIKQYITRPDAYVELRRKPAKCSCIFAFP
jgi:hypothetical protein